MALIFERLSYTLMFLIYMLIFVAGGYVLYKYFQHQTTVLRIQYHEEEFKQTREIKNRLHKAWRDEMERTILYAERILGESQGNVSQALSTLENTRKDIQRAFFIDAEMIYMAEWKKIRRRHARTRFNLGNTDHPDFKLAEIMEYQDKFYASAIKLYERFWLENPDNYNAANALARCLYKERSYKRALKIYRQIYRQNPAGPEQDEVPMAMTAGFQILNIHQAQGNSQAAKTFGLELFRDLLHEKWDLNEAKQNIFIERVKKHLKNYARKGIFHRTYQRLLRQEKTIEANKKVMRLISKKVIPFLEGSYAEDYYIYFHHHTGKKEMFLLIIPYKAGYIVLEIGLMKYLLEHYLQTLEVIEQEHIGLTLRLANTVLKLPNLMDNLVATFKLSERFQDLHIDVYLKYSLQQQLEEEFQNLKITLTGGAFLFWVVLTLFFWVLYKQLHLAEIKSDIISHVSHELKTPLTSLRAFSEMIQDEPRLPRRKVVQYCGFMQDESMRLARLIENLLDLTRLEKQKIQYYYKLTKLDKVVKKAVMIYKKNTIGQEHKVKIRLQKDLWLMLDSDALIRVLMNLLDNARKYSKPGTTITFTSTREDKYARLDIKDQGVGMSKPEMKKVFNKFYQVKRTYEEKYKGVGLGLAIVKNVIRAHKGKVKITSKLNHGTTVSLYLPLPKTSEES